MARNRRIVVDRIGFDWWQLSKGIAIFILGFLLCILASIDEVETVQPDQAGQGK